jgi:hypothetical protein
LPPQAVRSMPAVVASQSRKRVRSMDSLLSVSLAGTTNGCGPIFPGSTFR